MFRWFPLSTFSLYEINRSLPSSLCFGTSIVDIGNSMERNSFMQICCIGTTKDNTPVRHLSAKNAKQKDRFLQETFVYARTKTKIQCILYIMPLLFFSTCSRNDITSAAYSHSRPSNCGVTVKLKIVNFEPQKVSEDQIFELSNILQIFLKSPKLPKYVKSLTMT